MRCAPGCLRLLLRGCSHLQLRASIPQPTPACSPPLPRPQVCTEVAHEWLPLQPSLYLGSPAGDLAALSSPEWQAAAGREPARVRALLLAALPLLQRQLEAAEQADGGGAAANKRRLGPFQQAAAKARPRPGALRSLSDAALAAEAQRVLQRLQRALPRQRAAERGQVTAAVFRQAEVRARRQRRRGEQGGC